MIWWSVDPVALPDAVPLFIFANDWNASKVLLPLVGALILNTIPD